MSELVTTRPKYEVAVSSASIQNAIALWTKATTDAESARYEDMLRDKARAVADFFAFCDKSPVDVTPVDVSTWLDELRTHGALVDGEREHALAHSTVYAWASMLSSFYNWLREDTTLAQFVQQNPVDMARPKAPKAYRNAQALSDEEIDKLLRAVRYEAEKKNKLSAKRDYALLLFFLLTGHRREEVLRLTWDDVKRNGSLRVRFLVKGGDYVTEEVSLVCWDALVEYLRAAGRLDSMTPDTPLWTGHDRAGQATGALSSHSFAKNLKRYARLAGLEDIHIHQLRHTVARMVGEDTGDIGAVQRVLGHKNQQTTRIYAQRIMVKKDSHSDAIAKRFGL